MTPLFCTLDSQRIAELIRSARRFVCYAGPGVQLAPAQAMTEVAGRLGVEMLTVALDFDERVMRMGFGDMQAVSILRKAGIRVNDAPGLRTALIKAQKPIVEERLAALRIRLEAHQATIARELQNRLDASRQQIIDYYLQRVKDDPPDAMLGQLLHPKPTDDDARVWLEAELDKVFPAADSLIEKMQLDVRYKDVTYETLNQSDFLKAVEKAFPGNDWGKIHEEYLAAGEPQPRSGAV